MNENSRKHLWDAYEISLQYYMLLNLGYFFENLAQRINSSRLATNIQIQMPQEQTYTLLAQVINKPLQEIYDNPTVPSFFSHLILLNSIRGITMALATASEKEKGQEQNEFELAYQNDVFLGDVVIKDSFFGINRFIRNVLSHNINDKILIEEEDYKKQKQYREKVKEPLKPIMNFFYDYGNPSSAIYIPDYSPDLRVELDLTSIVQDQYLEDVIPTYQCLLFVEFCYNSLRFLSTKHNKKPS